MLKHLISLCSFRSHACPGRQIKKQLEIKEFLEASLMVIIIHGYGYELRRRN